MPLPLPNIFKTLDEKHRRILISAVMFLLVFLIGNNVIYKNAVKRKEYYNNRLQEIVAQNKLRKELHRLDGTKGGCETSILQKKDIDDIKNELSKLAWDSGVKVSSISSSRVRGPANYNVFSTTLQLECSYHQLGNFISKIENAEPYIGIKSIKLGSPGMQFTTRWGEPATPEHKTEGDIISAVSLVLETYSLRK